VFPIHKAGTDIIQDGQPAENPDNLEGPGNAKSVDRVGFETDDVFFLEEDLALVGRIITRDQVDQGRLARPVGADQPNDLSGSNGKGDLFDSAEATKPPREVQTP
jgi:hypothetical protein